MISVSMVVGRARVVGESRGGRRCRQGFYRGRRLWGQSHQWFNFISKLFSLRRSINFT
jgi:hypothetical protein